MDDFEVIKTSVKAVTTYVVKIARDLGLDIEPEDVSRLL